MVPVDGSVRSTVLAHLPALKTKNVSGPCHVCFLGFPDGQHSLQPAQTKLLGQADCTEHLQTRHMEKAKCLSRHNKSVT